MKNGFDAKAVGDFVDKYLESRWNRMLAGRYFEGTVRTVSQDATGGYVCTISRGGEGTDGLTYRVFNPGYVPQVGDVVEGFWRDLKSAYLLWPKAPRSSVGVVPMKIGEVGPLAAAQPNASFPAISQGFRHLRLKYSVRSTAAATVATLSWQANGDTGANYFSSFMYEPPAGGAPLGGLNNLANQGYGPQISGASSAGGCFGDGTIDFLDYASASKQKGAVATGGYTDAGNKSVMTRYSTWAATPAILSLLIFPDGGSFAAGSVLTLYGEP